MATNLEIAQYMIDELLEKGLLYQENVVQDIHSKFGEEFIYYNENGNPAISKNVLKEFKKLKVGHNIEWDRSGRCWTV